MSRLMLLDTPSLYFRAYFGVPESVKAPDGTPVNAVRGLIDMIARLVADRRPERLVCCFDADWRPAFRVAAIPSYKAHRVAEERPGGDVEETPDTLLPQLPVIDAVLDALGLARSWADGYEADDVIGTLAARDAGPVDIVTGDRDLFQLVDDAREVRVLYTARGIRNLQVFGEREVSEKYGIPGRAYADFATLRGDPSDGLPGVPGVGEKTAAALVTRFGSLAGILEAVDSGVTEGFPAGSRKRIEAARAYLGPAELVCRVVTDLPLTVEDALPKEPKDPEALVALADRWNLASPVNRLLAAL
ncbi:5'-3' exonuclease [Actinocorallia sp. A-T 12471]|uniref:5'-3' exonuclease n=1 Tax=Actinocorallia sp. A-T 12471 TaxID=3089813 RepID=UPI0029CEA938|nr:5'-3' exonuclease H3TH domain-containing protein [Actinocorallia sp. A-T 12471]MDX6744261.1 5'-3' exonuclease H3TH domain-containing protein [Actinocorallia sp. A-T 12471]